MAASVPATTSKSNLMASLTRAKSTLKNMRAEAERGIGRMTIGVVAPASAYGTGVLHGWAERTGKKLTIGSSPITWSAAAGAVATVAGAFGTSLVGDTIGNVMLGAGSGVLSAETALIGYRHGVTPPE